MPARSQRCRPGTTTTTATTREKPREHARRYHPLRRIAAVSGASGRLVATGFLAVGALIVYLVLLDQGAAAAVLFGSTAGNENVLHEHFHDGRHLLGAPCH